MVSPFRDEQLSVRKMFVDLNSQPLCQDVDLALIPEA